MPALRSTKAEACAQLLAKGDGMSEYAAYRKAYGATEKSAKANASRAMEKDGIRARVAEIQENAAEKFGLSRVKWLEMFLENAKKGQKLDDLAASNGALREIGKAIPGWYASEKVDVTVYEAPETVLARALALGLMGGKK